MVWDVLFEVCLGGKSSSGLVGEVREGARLRMAILAL